MTTLLHGECRDRMRSMPEASIDAIVTDPPYGLEFMGKAWDGAEVGDSPGRQQAWHETWAREAYRVLKPGGHLLSFGGTRTYHRMACAVEDAGFEVRDQLQWLYGSGFPKSKNLCDCLAKGRQPQPGPADEHGWVTCLGGCEGWIGLGTALKPAHEPIVKARKPLIGTVASNVAEHGTGALNINGCRIEGAPPSVPQPSFNSQTGLVYGFRTGEGRNGDMSSADGRWPANVVLSHAPECREVGVRRVKTSDPRRADGTVNGSWGTKGIYGSASSSGMEKPRYGDADGYETVTAWECAPDCAVALLDAQSGGLKSPKPYTRKVDGSGVAKMFDGRWKADTWAPAENNYGDSGGASRFFYCAKASRSERSTGLDGLPRANHHPTVKPIAVMRWLVRLVTPPGGTVLDPFMGSGTTGIAAALEGFDFIGVEQDAEYLEIADRRITYWAQKPRQVSLPNHSGAIQS